MDKRSAVVRYCVHEDVVVEHLDPNVAVEAGGNDIGQDGEDIAGSLPPVGRDALVSELIGISRQS